MEMNALKDRTARYMDFVTEDRQPCWYGNEIQEKGYDWLVGFLDFVGMKKSQFPSSGEHISKAMYQSI